MKFLKTVIGVTSVMLLFSPAWAINKCTGADGRVVFQDASCEASTKVETVKTWDSKLTERQKLTPAVEPDLAIVAVQQAKPLLDLYRRWADAEKLAMLTGRIALAGPIANMQALQREAEAMAVPQCVSVPHKALVELTRKSVQGLLDFMGKQGLDGMLYTMIDRKKLIPAFEDAVKKSKCE